MLSTPWTAAPAGLSGLGVDVRPHAADCALARPDLGGAVIPVQGTRVPTVAVRQRGTGLFATGMPTTSQYGTTSQQFDQIPQHGNTLGNHPSGRPLS
jgi:hypothetical protein